MKKSGRPVLNEKEKKKFYFKFRINEKEKKTFNQNYEKFLKRNNLNSFQFTKTDFIKYFILDEKKNEKIYKFNVGKLVFEINKIGNNINQISKKINSFFIYDSKIDKEIDNLKAEFSEVIELLNKNLNNR